MSEALQSLFVLGSTHHEAPLEVRERMALTPENAAALQQELHARDDIRECLVVNTCNRVEVYGLCQLRPTSKPPSATTSALATV